MLPEQLKPMLAVPGPLPHDDDDQWAYEFKWDGVRAVLRVEGGRVQAWSRLGNDKTSQFPEVARALAAWARRLAEPTMTRASSTAMVFA